VIVDYFNEKITVYRVLGIKNYDFSTSDEGEIKEVWRVVRQLYGSHVKDARFEPEDTPTTRKDYGLADIGNHLFFVRADTNIQNGDRIYRPEGETGVDFFNVMMVKPIRDFMHKIHHKEIHCEHIDWIAPVYTDEWYPMS